jgi:glycosyltransferase involved in cell wall biosynthesis
MLVDNNVVADSRVQKQARSAAAHGWDVILLGQQRAGTKRRWRIGDAQVRLVEVGKVLSRRHDARRSGRFRSPLAYSRPAQAAFREQLMQAKTVDVRTARAALDADPPSGVARPWAKARLWAQRVVLAGQRRWTRLRVRRTTELLARRKSMTTPLDRFTTGAWGAVLGSRSWRVLDPGLWEWELAYGPVIDKLRPDLIHANDFRMLAVGARAKLRARAQGRDVRLVWDAHEFLPGIRPWNAHPRWHRAQVALEQEFASSADAVVTVSDDLADLLVAAHGLTTRPTVVPNTPQLSVTPVDRAGAMTDTDGPSVRRSCGLTSEQPLLVYSGAVNPARGLLTAVEALRRLPDVHLALVVSQAKHTDPHVLELRAVAATLGVDDRLHLLPYVDVDQIVGFLSSADVGLIPIQHYPNHEISLITKFYEYSHARLPIVVSDVKAMSATVRQTGQGEVFVADDVASFATAVSAVLADPDRYRRAYDAPGLLDGWTWDAAAERLDAVYARLMEEK